MSRRCWQLQGTFDVKGETITVEALRGRTRANKGDNIVVNVYWRDQLKLPQSMTWTFDVGEKDGRKKYPRFTAALLQLVLGWWEDQAK